MAATGLDTLNKLKSTDPPLFLSRNSDLSLSSRSASQYLFAYLKPYTPKSPFDQLLTDGFDVEQIWQQIDIQSQPLISSLKREIRRFEKNPDQISSLFRKSEVNGGLERGIKENGDVGFEVDSDEFEGLSDGEDGDEDEDEEYDAAEEREIEEGEEDDDEEDEGEDEDDISEGEGVPEVEDEFLKIKDLEKYLAREEKREYGSEEKKNKKKGKTAIKAPREEDDEEDMEDEEDNDEGDADELLLYGGDEDDEEEGGADIRYEDFFVPGKKAPKRKRKQDESGGSGAEDEDDDEHKKGKLSTYEKERQKIEAKIKEMEEANLGEKDWTMRGEVTAAKRPKDSALEVDLDFEQNVRPPPVITEVVTASLEDIIKKRILEGNFDDVQMAPKLPSKAPKEFKELDDKKSTKGLAEVYEEEYAQQTGLAAPVSFNDELRTEASKLFKALCLKLDALSHFHFAPKPVVEDMSVQANVPALAMEEIAPMAVSDAAMLAPEEVFAGKGDIKEETELTKEDRKRRRAKKKRKFKAAKAKRTAERASDKNKVKTNDEGKEQ